MKGLECQAWLFVLYLVGNHHGTDEEGISSHYPWRGRELAAILRHCPQLGCILQKPRKFVYL